MNKTLDLLNLRRKHGRTAPSLPTAKIGLVVEGGGMRGVISCAYLEALQQLGYSECFDRVYGTSAGALNGAYFVSKQSVLGTSIYYDGLCTKEFINIFRWPNPMDLNLLFDDWVCGKKALDAPAVLKSDILLTICATDCATGNSGYFTSNSMDRDTLIQSMRASASTPMFTTHTETINGVEYNDGLVNDGIPLARAISDGCTHVLCLLTRPKGYRKKQNPIIKVFEDIRLSRFPAPYRAAFHSRQQKYNSIAEMIEQNNNPVLDIFSIAPQDGDAMVGNGETNRPKLMRAASSSVSRAATTLGMSTKNIRLGAE